MKCLTLLVIINGCAAVEYFFLCFGVTDEEVKDHEDGEVVTRDSVRRVLMYHVHTLVDGCLHSHQNKPQFHSKTICGQSSRSYMKRSGQHEVFT